MATPVTLGAILKTIQGDGLEADEELVRESSFMKSIPHIKDFHSKDMDWSVPYSGLGGRSHDAVKAEAKDVNGAYGLFRITPRKDYDRRSIDGQLTREALKGGVNTQFIDYLKGERNLAVAAIGQNLARAAQATHTGTRAVVGAISGSTFTCATIDDSMYINIGDDVRFSATDGGAVRTGTLTVTKVNTATGVVTCSAGIVATIGAAVVGDFVTIDGDLNVSYFGLGSYCPAVEPTGGDAVFPDIDRSLNPEMLAGIRLTTTGQSVETVLIRAMAYCRKRPGAAFKGARILCSEEDFASIRVAKEGSRFVDSANQYNMEIEGFMVGSAAVIPDVFTPTGAFFITCKNALELHSNDGIVIDSADGNEMRKAAGDTYTLMALLDANFKCPNPAGIARGTWPTT